MLGTIRPKRVAQFDPLYPQGEDHLKEIIDTYQFKGEKDRYCRKVSIEEIESNGYNLNISRYVSTSEDEIQIDLKEVNTKLLSINETINAKTEEHNAFLRGLDLI